MNTQTDTAARLAASGGQSPGPAPRATPLRIAGVIGLLTVILVAFLVAFALPGLRAEPKAVPVAVVAPEPAFSQLTAAAERAQPGAVEWVAVADAAAALELIDSRDVVGALMVTASGLEVAAPTAVGSSVSAVVVELGERVGEAAGLEVTVTDPVPFTSEDPRGIGLAAGALPIALGGWIAAVGIIAVVRGSGARIAAALGFAVVGGAAMTAVLRFWFGTFGAHYPTLALAGMLGIAATSLLVLGLQRLLRGVGIACAAIILILFGNPLSGLTTAKELLPTPWGSFGQWLPPGATGSLLRNVGFFDLSTVWFPAAVLCGWIAIGVGAYLLGGLRERREASIGAAGPVA